MSGGEEERSVWSFLTAAIGMLLLASLFGMWWRGWEWVGAANAAVVFVGLWFSAILLHSHWVGDVYEEHPWAMLLPWSILAGVLATFR